MRPKASDMPDDDPRVLAVVALAHPEATGSPLSDAGSRSKQAARSHRSRRCDARRNRRREVGRLSSTRRRFLARAMEGLREQGRLGLLDAGPRPLRVGSNHTGDWEAARGGGRRRRDLARDSRQPQFGLTGELIVGLVAALRGNDEEVEEMIAKPEQTLLAMGGGPLLAPAHLARGAAAIGDGRNGDAYEYLWPIFDESAPAFHRFMRWSGLLDLVEAGVMQRARGRPRRRYRANSRRSRIAVEPTDSRGEPASRKAARGRRRGGRARSSRRHSLAIERATRSCAPGRCSHSAAGCAGSDVAPTRACRCARRSTCSTRSGDALGRARAAGAARHRREDRATHARRPRSPDRPGASDRPACG